MRNPGSLPPTISGVRRSGAQAISAGLKSGDLSSRQFARFARRQRQRYLSFRRFVLGFYTAPFRDLFFNQKPPPRIFNAIVTHFAGYWRPSLTTRLWVTLFFALVWLQRFVPIAPPVWRAQDQGVMSDTSEQA